MIKSKKVLCSIVLLILTGSLIWVGVELRLSATDWAAWVQAVGSVGAIVGAFLVLNMQNQHDQEERKEQERKTKRDKLSSLRWVMVNLAELFEDCAKSVGSEHAAWELKAGQIAEQGKILNSISYFEYPDSSILPRVREVQKRLFISQSLAYSMRRDRAEAVQHHVKQMFLMGRDSALCAVTESSMLLVRYSKDDELEEDMQFVASKEYQELTEELILKMGKEPVSRVAKDSI